MHFAGILVSMRQGQQDTPLVSIDDLASAVLYIFSQAPGLVFTCSPGSFTLPN